MGEEGRGEAHFQRKNLGEGKGMASFEERKWGRKILLTIHISPIPEYLYTHPLMV